MKSCFQNKKERIDCLNEVTIYPVISSEFCNNRPVVEVFEAIAIGGAKMVQIREKNLFKGEILKIAKCCREIANDYKMLLIINDHIDIAQICGADGVHLGQDDLPLKESRSLIPELIIGSSTHDLQEAIYADKNGASYLNIGPIFDTQTKQLSYKSLGIEAIDAIQKEISIPFTVMGGIKEHHIADLVAHGAKHIAMVTEITKADDISEKVKNLISLMQR